ncbi:MAG: hypothetical protein LC679_06880, partial [Intrasporangiaceae bacterium]|nr:hypothetical protein [Intrasporangiaceae bacterium]
MSTYIFLTCLDHDPPIVADAESGQHLYDLPRIRAEIADRDTVAAEADLPAPSALTADIDTYFRARSAWFLADHPRCNIGI